LITILCRNSPSLPQARQRWDLVIGDWLFIIPRMPLDDANNPLAIEIRQEMAASYFAACKKMVDSLEALKAFDRAVTTPASGQTARRSELLDAAAERVLFVLIQREAMKLSWDEHFFEDYGVPAEVKARLGSRWPG
jgi:hypothetical protein